MKLLSNTWQTLRCIRLRPKYEYEATANHASNGVEPPRGEGWELLERSVTACYHYDNLYVCSVWKRPAQLNSASEEAYDLDR